MDSRTTGVVSYLTWIGWGIAYLFGDRKAARFHLNQALVLNLAELLSFIPVIGWIWGICCFVWTVMGCFNALNGKEKRVPILGNIQLLK